jgi:hypothetical protein
MYYKFDTLKVICVDSMNERYMSIDGMLIEKKTGGAGNLSGSKV